MTFKILNDEAREQIAAHIFGAAPQGHPRAGSVSGTDAPAKSYEPLPFKYGGTHTYLTGGSGPTGSQGQGGLSIVCIRDPRLPATVTGPVPQTAEGKCPPPSGNVVWKQAGNMCCPTFNEAEAQDGPVGSPGGVRPPTGQPPVVQCPSGMTDSKPGVAVSMASVSSPQFGPASSACRSRGGHWNVKDGFGYCCYPETPSEPPSGTGTGTGEVKEDDGHFPETWNDICSVATPVADIASKSWGWATIMTSVPAAYPETGSISCTNINDGQFTGQTFSSDTSCENIVTFTGAVYAYNPGGSTIARNTQVVVVRMKDPSEFSLVTRAIIVVVPCT